MKKRPISVAFVVSVVIAVAFGSTQPAAANSCSHLGGPCKGNGDCCIEAQPLICGDFQPNGVGRCKAP